MVGAQNKSGKEGLELNPGPLALQAIAPTTKSWLLMLWTLLINKCR